MQLDGSNPFSYTLDASDIRMINYNIKVKSVPIYIQECLAELDLPNNHYIQTIHFRYKWLMAALIYLGYDKSMLETIHKANLQYEVTNPPVIYEKTKAKKSIKLKKTTTAKKSAPATPVRKCGNGMVRLVKIEDGKALTVSRETANALVIQFNNMYKIEEI